MTNGKIRRVVTGHDGSGKAVVVSDGPAPFLHESAGRPGFWSNDIWRTADTPARMDAMPVEPTLGPRRQLPAERGSVIRVNHFPPDTGALDADAIRKEFEGLGNTAASTHRASAGHAMMHRTETVDYAIVLSGEIYLILDDSEVKLQAGDIVVQNGTNHAWSNRSDRPCTMAFILLDGAYESQLKGVLGKDEPAA